MKLLIKQVVIIKDKLLIKLNDGSDMIVPKTYTKRLKEANKDQLLNYRLICNGIGVRFIDIDEDISLDGLINDYKAKRLKWILAIS